MTMTETLIRQYFDAFNSKDSEAMLALLHEDVVHDINQGGREIGKEKFRWFLATMNRHYSEQLSDIVIMTSSAEGRAAAEFTVRGNYQATADGLPAARGQSYSIAAGQFFEIDQGLITRVTTYYNLEEWIAQVRDE
nr:ketosteroid isomerase-related protein [Flavimaribacter sediminis]